MPVIRGNKPIQLIRIDDASDWDDVKALTGDFLLPQDLGGLKQLLDGFVRSVYIEHDYMDADYRDTYSHFYSKKFARYPDRAIRLLFFSDAIAADDWSEPARFSNAFIGYSVIKPNRIVSVGRTVIDPRHANVAPGFVIVTKFVANLLGAELTVKGFPYMGQDTDVTVCAHSALWSCLRHFSQRYPEYPEIHPYEITQLTTDFSRGRLIPSQGLTMEQVTEILTRYGFHPRFYDKPDLKRQVDFERLLYTYIESGIPVIVSLDLLDGSAHAVAGIGHSSDFSVKLSPGIRWSYEYFNGLIVNDDNLPPYRLVPKKFGSNASYTLGDIKGFIVPLYEKIYLAAEDAFSMVETILSNEEIGLSTLRPPGLLPDDLVIRLFLISSRSWKRNRRRSRMPNDDLGLLYSTLPMPKFIWVAELSTRALYPDGKVLGEIVIDATANLHDRFAFLSIHYPHVLILNDRDSLSGSLASRISSIYLSEHSAYRLYANNLKEIECDKENNH
ncbi:MAG: hypothetical protein LGR52_13980 [Candidatus Thiosymbion ectosymbiont of Robbea hypermnestra]|nr:hypothetical protein [Candidatus Thiosymbion ectosymbiont of Robbea hypermnestra]